MLTSTTFVSVDDSGFIFTGDLSGNSTQRLNLSDAAIFRPSNIVKATNGYLYILMGSNTSTSFAGIMLLRSIDSGVTWEIKVISSDIILTAYTSSYQFDYLTEYDTNLLAFAPENVAYGIDETGGT